MKLLRQLLRCDENTPLASRRMDGEASATERLIVSAHLLICPPCRAHDRLLRRMKTALHESSVPTPPETVDRVVRHALEKLPKD